MLMLAVLSHNTSMAIIVYDPCGCSIDNHKKGIHTFRKAVGTWKCCQENMAQRFNNWRSCFPPSDYEMLVCKLAAQLINLQEYISNDEKGSLHMRL